MFDINGSINFRNNTITVGTAVDGSTPKMAEGGYTEHKWWVVPFYVYGSREIKEIEVDFLDMNGNSLWVTPDGDLYKFTERSMNEAVGVNVNVEGVKANASNVNGGAFGASI